MVFGSIAGIRLARHLHGRGRILSTIFAGVVAVVGLYVTLHGFGLI